MEWLLILALAIWVWRQGRRIDVLTRQVRALEMRAAPMPAPEPDDVLVLDTPLPEASNDEDDLSPAPQAKQPPPEGADILVLSPVAPPLSEADGDLLLTEEVRPNPVAPRARKLEQWLAENGLAWLGGGAFALGAVMLVAIATQQSWFTPMVRLYCALALGAGLIGASEWLRRRPGAHALVAALLAGAGASAFYATVWGAHALYAYIDAPTAGAALAFCALILLALAFRHGEALGVLAVLAAFLGPALTNADAWPAQAATLYLGAAAAAGFGVAGARRWAWVGVATLLGLYFWFAVCIGEGNVRRALALAAFASLGGVAVAFRQPLPGAPASNLSWPRARALAPSVAICISSIALIWTWLAVAEARSGVISGPAWVGAMFVALAAASVRARAAPAAVIAVAIGALVAGFIAYLAVRFHPLDAQFYPFILFAAAVIAASAIGARPHRRDRALVAIAGGAGAALLTALGAFSVASWRSPMAYAPLFLGAAGLLGVAWLQARQALKPYANLAIDAWACGGAALALLGVESLFAADIRAAAHAGAALAFAAAYMRQGWRGLGWGALAAATLSLAHAFLGDTAGAALSLAAPIAQTLGVIGLAAGFLFGAAFACARRDAPSPIGEALSAAAIVLVVLAAFLGLRWLAVGGAGAPLDHFIESALRALAVFAAAHVIAPRQGQRVGAIGALRGHALMGLGLVLAAAMNAIALNPWWGAAPAAIPGPPLFNALALGFAAPAGFLLFAARRLYPHARVPARLYAGAGALFALLWALMEIRRGFHGADLSVAQIGALETACYGLLFIVGAVIAAFLAQVRQGQVGADMRAIRAGVAWAGILLGGGLLLIASQVWWAGGGDRLTGFWLALSLISATVLALMLGRLLSLRAGMDPTRFAAAAAACVFAWSAGHSLIGWSMQGAALAPLLHSLWPLALTVLGAELTRRAPGRDSVRHYLYDLQAIWATAAWPASAAAVLGLWLLFNPWWGLAPAITRTAPESLALLALMLAGASMTAQAMQIPHLRKPEWFAPAMRVALAAYLFAAATLAVRAAFHDGALAPGGADGAELWTYSAIWALFGAGALAYGARRDDAVLRWCGLVVLFATAAKVFAFDTARLSGIIRVASLLGLAAVATLTALAMRRMRARGS